MAKNAKKVLHIKLEVNGAMCWVAILPLNIRYTYCPDEQRMEWVMTAMEIETGKEYMIPLRLMYRMLKNCPNPCPSHEIPKALVDRL